MTDRGTAFRGGLPRGTPPWLRRLGRGDVRRQRHRASLCRSRRSPCSWPCSSPRVASRPSIHSVAEVALGAALGIGVTVSSSGSGIRCEPRPRAWRSSGAALREAEERAAHAYAPYSGLGWGPWRSARRASATRRERGERVVPGRAVRRARGAGRAGGRRGARCGRGRGRRRRRATACPAASVCRRWPSSATWTWWRAPEARCGCPPARAAHPAVRFGGHEWAGDEENDA